MSYGGSYNTQGGNSDDWNDPFRDRQQEGQQQQQLSPESPGKARRIHNNSAPESAGFGAPQRSAFGNDPFGADDDFAESGNGFGYETAVVVPVISSMNTPTNNSRFGRPSTSNMNSDSDFGHHTTRQHQQQKGNSITNRNTNYGREATSGAPSLGRQDSTDRYRGGTGGGSDHQFGGGAAAISSNEPTSRSGRASLDMMHGRNNSQSSSVARSITESYSGGRGSQASHGSNELNRFLEPSLGVGVSTVQGQGVAIGVSSSSLGDPYPSLRNSSTPGAYASSDSSHKVPPAAAARRSNSLSCILPPKKEATPIMPPSLVVEPTLPRPKVSRRFLPYTKQARQPDLAVAKKVKNARYKAGDDDKHVLKCPNCQSFLKIPKLAVLMQCPTCSTVSPATTMASAR